MGVRNERVVLDLEDNFTSGMARAAAAAALLNRELNNLSGQTIVTARVTQNISRDTDNIAKAANKADNSINQLTGRLRLFAEVAAILGPGLIPIGAVGIPAVAGLANQFGVAALAGGTAIIAFQGVGDALKAVNEAAIEPSAANLEKAREAMAKLSPAAQDMVTRLQELRPVMTGLRDTAAEGLFPGVIEMFDNLEKRVPEVEAIISNVSETLGGLASDAGADLASEQWDEFFDFLAVDAPQTLESLGRTVGSLTHGMAELWMAFDPLNDDFGSWLEDVAQGFDDWATGLAQTEGFEEFIDYIRDTGPQVAETFGAIASAVIEIVEAASPLGGPVLAALEGVAKAVAAIADSDFGTPIMAGLAALSLFSRSQKVLQGTMATTWGSKAKANVTGMADALTTVVSAQDRARMSATQLEAAERRRAEAVRRGMATVGKSAALMGSIALASTGAADSLGFANTVTLGLLGTLGGPFGVAAGVAVGGFLDLKASADEAADSVARFEDALSSGDDMVITAEIERLQAELNRLTTAAPWDLGAWIDAGGVGAPRVKEITDQIEMLKGALDAPQADGLARILGGSLPDSLGLTDAAFDAASASASEFRESLARVNAALDGRSDMRDYQAALDDFSAAFKENGEAVNKSRTAFRRGTEAGRAMESALDNIANTALAAAEHLKGLNRVRYLQQARRDFIAAAREAGLSRDAARALADQLGLLDRVNARPKIDVQGVPESKKKVSDVDKAFRVLDRLMAKPRVSVDPTSSFGTIAAIMGGLNNIPRSVVSTVTVIHRTINETVNTIADNPLNPGAWGTRDANGGIHKNGVRTFADGGWGSDGRYYERVPQIVRGGANILWGELETGEEAYISRKRGMEARNIAILNEAASWFGMGLKRYANGGVSSSTSHVDSSRSVQVTMSGPMYTTNPQALAREVEQRMRDAVALMAS